MSIVNRKPFGHRFNDLTGQQFGRLTVIKFAGFNGASAAWHCKCRCGKKSVITARSLRSGHTKSCGCICNPFGRNLTYDRIAWYAIPRDSLCRRWRKFENFYADMGPRPPGQFLTLRPGRKLFSKANCLWSPFKRARVRTQSTNWPGKVAKPAAQSARELGISRQALHQRLKRMSVAAALSIPNLQPWRRTKRANGRGTEMHHS